jgi:hypothetical protein
MARDIQIRITEDGEVWGGNKLFFTRVGGYQITLRINDGAYFVTIHRETYPGRRVETDHKVDSNTRRIAPIRKVPMSGKKVQP